MKRYILCTALGLSLALSSLTVGAQPKDPKKPTTPTPVPTPTPTPTPIPVPISSPPQSSSGTGEFKLSWGEAVKEDEKREKDKDEEKPPPPGVMRLTWGTEAEDEETSGGLLGDGLGRFRNSRVIIVFVGTFKKLPLIRRINFEARKLELEKKKAEHKKAKK
jgi:hypothetical protein